MDVFAIALVWTVASILIFRRRYGRLDPFAPGIVITLTLAVAYLGPYFAFEAGIDGFSQYAPFQFDDREGSVTIALLLYCLILAGIHLGCLLARPAPLERPRSGSVIVLTGTQQLTSFPYWALVLGAAFALFLSGVALLGGVGALLSGLGDRIRLFAGLNYFFIPTNAFLSAGLVSAAVLFGSSNKKRADSGMGKLRHRLAFLLLGALAIFFGAVLGNKSTIYVFVLATAVCFHYCRRRFSLVELAVCGAVLFAGLIAYQLVVREILVTGEIVSLEDTSVMGVLEYLALAFSGNLMQLQTLSVLVDQVPAHIDFQWGKTFLAFVTLPIPSTIWPDKLLPSPGIFTLAFWPDMWLEHGTTIPPGLFGEWYMNFGCVGVFVGAVLLSFVFERYYADVGLREKVDAASLLYYSVLVATLLHYVRGEISAPTLLLLSIVAPIWLASRLFSRRNE